MIAVTFHKNNTPIFAYAIGYFTLLMEFNDSTENLIAFCKETAPDHDKVTVTHYHHF